MLEDPGSRRKLFFVSMTVGVVSTLVVLVRNAGDPEARLPNALMLVALVGFGVTIVLELRKGRRRR